MTTSIYQPVKHNNGSLESRFTDFLIHSYEVHGTKYDYSQVVYVNNKSKVEIICPEHGSFFQRCSDHKIGSGCNICSLSKIRINRGKNTNIFIIESNKIHKSKYDYSKTRYVNARTKVEIICPEHGSFFQRSASHTNGSGCPICSYKIYGLGITEWNVTENSPDKDRPHCRYILKLSNDTEYFYKFGITKNIDNRINKIRLESDYKISIIDLYYGSKLDCYKLEQKLKRTMKQKGRNYLPLVSFAGKTECFT